MLKKNLLSLILALCLCMTLIAPAWASDDDFNLKVENQKIFEDQIYQKTDFAENIFKSEDGHYIMAIQTSDSENNTPYTLMQNEFIIPVERIDIDFADKQSVNTFINRSDIPEEIIDDFNNKYKQYLSTDYDELETPRAMFFMPTTTSSGPGLPDKTLYYTYKGYDMMTYQFIYTSLSSGWKNVKKGTSTMDTVKLIKDVSISIGSIISDRLAYFSTGKSIFDAFVSWAGTSSNSVSPNVNDYFQARLVWDETVQHTMTDYGGTTSWQIGLVTYKVTIKKLGQETYFANTGKVPYTTDRDYNVTVKSPHYDNPWATAFTSGSYNTQWEYISWSTGSIRYDFT